MRVIHGWPFMMPQIYTKAKFPTKGPLQTYSAPSFVQASPNVVCGQRVHLISLHLISISPGWEVIQLHHTHQLDQVDFAPDPIKPGCYTMRTVGAGSWHNARLLHWVWGSVDAIRILEVIQGVKASPKQQYGVNLHEHHHHSHMPPETCKPAQTGHAAR